MTYNYEDLFKILTRRYGDLEPDALIRVLCPLAVPIRSIDTAIFKTVGQNHWRASFTLDLTKQFNSAITVGRTGKFIPGDHLTGSPWREIAKGRILAVDQTTGTAKGEIYLGASSKKSLELALTQLSDNDYLEIDQFGASASILSALVESTLATELEGQGYKVKKMPEDMAKHLGVYANYDFEVTLAGHTKKIEVKSLWGTDTRYARLIHSTGKNYPTSSCKFATQDIFAVSLFLRTGNLSDFAFARSIPVDLQSHGLKRARKYPDHVNQNPLCNLGDGTWFPNLHEVWELI